MPRFNAFIWIILIVVSVATGAGLLGYGVWRNIAETRLLVETTRRLGDAVANADVDRAKTREEYIGKLYENEARSNVVTFLLSSLGQAITLLGALGGGLFAVYGYIDVRRKEASDRAASDLKDTLARLAGKEAQERVIGVVGLQHFLVADRRQSHRAAVTALVAAARTEQDPEVRHSLRIAIEQAMRIVDRNVLTQVSWQNVKADGADLAGLRLDGLDLRDAELQDARLEGIQLNGARLNAAKLQGARFDRAQLRNADLTYADLAGASVAGADLQGAKLSRASVSDLDLNQAKLQGIELDDWEIIPWDKTRNWRNASFDTALRNKLIERYGPGPSGPRVLMLMWEIPPFVAGGTWTACFHLVRNLVRRGADLTIVVPWSEAAILTAPFGSEVKIVPMGIRLPQQFVSPYAPGGGYGFARASPYGEPSWSPYARTDATGAGAGAAAWSPYAPPAWSPYSWLAARAQPYSVDSPAGSQPPPRGPMEGSILLRLIDEFRERFVRYAAGQPADIIHAHDWVTFEAARDGARRNGIPWIAHVHSIEIERQPAGANPLVEQMEQQALAAATAIVAPSRITQRRIRERYGVAPERIHVVPNVLSSAQADAPDAGQFESRRVIFLGRLSEQKGIDRFVEVAAALRQRVRGTTFEIYGSGYDAAVPGWISFHGPLPWQERGRAFRDASVLIVPSRAEPFGMVILEAMVHRVPVVYPRDAGAAEVLQSGVQVDQNDIGMIAGEAERLLTDLLHWENVVQAQLAEIAAYPSRGFERDIINLWGSIGVRPAARNGRPE